MACRPRTKAAEGRKRQRTAYKLRGQEAIQTIFSINCPSYATLAGHLATVPKHIL
jgi:hypothetical protein